MTVAPVALAGEEGVTLKIRIFSDSSGVSMVGALGDSETAKAIVKALPIKSKAQVWGEEVYFEVPVHMPEQDSHSSVPPGSLAYWPPGHAFCIFFGQTPYSPVNVVGELEGDAKEFSRVRSGETICIELLE